MDTSKAKQLAGAAQESIAAIRSEADNAHQRLGDLIREKSEILASPVTRNDYIQMLWDDIDARADLYAKKVGDRLVDAALGREGASVRGAPATVSALLLQSKRGADGSKSSLGNVRDAFGRDQDEEPLTQLAATFFCREEMKMSIAEALNSIGEWPYTEAISLENSVERLSAIDSEIKEINAQLDELRSIAQELGLELEIRQHQADGFDYASIKAAYRSFQGLPENTGSHRYEFFRKPGDRRTWLRDRVAGIERLSKPGDSAMWEHEIKPRRQRAPLDPAVAQRYQFFKKPGDDRTWWRDTHAQTERLATDDDDGVWSST